MPFLDLIAPIVSHRILARELRLQAKLGYRFSLVGHPPGWINGFMLADMMNRLNPGLGVRGHNFTPSTSSDGPSYSSLQLHGYLAIHHLAPDLKAVLYVCSVYPPGIDASIMRELITKHITINKVPS